MTREEAEGTTDTLACRFWMVRHTVILRPFQSPVAFAMSSPIFLGDYNIQSYAQSTSPFILLDLGSGK